MKFLYLFSLLVLLFSGVFSQEEEDPSNGLQDAYNDLNEQAADDVAEADDSSNVEQIFITSSPFVLTSSLFPRYADARVPLGKVVEILLGFKNFGQKAFNVTLIHGSLRYTQDPTIYIQNFTSWRGGALVKPGQHLTFQYFFFPDELLEPKDYVLVVTTLYTDEDNVNYTSSFYNGTIVIYEVGLVFDLQTTLLTLFIIAFFGVVGYLIYINLIGKGKRLISSISGSSDKKLSGNNLSSSGGSSGGSSSQVNNEWTSELDLQWQKPKTQKKGKK